MTQLKIKVTKEILEKSKYCGTGDVSGDLLTHNCAIALAVRDIFPHAWVEVKFICPAGASNYFTAAADPYKIELPIEATEFIDRFDITSVIDRPNLPELEFTIDIPDAVIEQINIEEIRPLLINHPTLELVEG